MKQKASFFPAIFLILNNKHENTDYVIAAYKGFTTIKLYDLKGWYLKKLSKLHKKYIKTGNEGELAGSIEIII